MNKSKEGLLKIIWAFLHAVCCIFLAEKAKKDVASIVNASKNLQMNEVLINL
jgi:hypothetical protein